jgi:hypothetical protein
MVKTAAIDQDVWLCCGSDQSAMLDIPKDLSAQLTATQERLYTLKLNDYERKRKGLAKVNAVIQSTVYENHQTYLGDTYSPRQRLRALRTEIKPLLRQGKDTMGEEYDHLIKGLKRSLIDK